MSFISKLFRFITMRAVEGLIVIFLVAFMPNLPPYCKISEPRTITPSLPLKGKLAVNNKLDNVELWHKGDLHGPESFADYDGELYTSLHSGDIVKLTGNHITPIVKFGKPCKGTYQERICGRPLGIEFDKDGSLVAADAYYGIFRVNVKTGEKVQLVSPNVEIEGKKPKVTNSIAIASNGDIFWSDSSTEFLLQDGAMDMFADGSGRLIHYNAKTKENKVLIENLLFANGVALAADEEYVIVAETGTSVIHRYYLKGPKKGTKDKFIDGLPGLPDNLKRDGKGGFFVPLVVARDEDHPLPTQFLAPWPFIRKFVSRVFGLTEFGFNLVHQVYPNEYTERAIHFVGHFTSLSLLLPKRVTILHISKDGEIIQSFHTTNNRMSSICEMHIFKDTVYLGSPFADYIGRIPLKDLGLEEFAKKKSVPQTTEIPPAPVEVPTTTTTPKPTTTTQKPTTTEKPKATMTTNEPTTEKPKTTTTKPTPTEKASTTKPTEKTTTSKPVTTTKEKPNTEKSASTQKSTASPKKDPELKQAKEESIRLEESQAKPAKVGTKPSTPPKEAVKPAAEVKSKDSKRTPTSKPVTTHENQKNTGSSEKSASSTQKTTSSPNQDPESKQTKEQSTKSKERPEKQAKVETKASTPPKEPVKPPGMTESKDSKKTTS